MTRPRIIDCVEYAKQHENRDKVVVNGEGGGVHDFSQYGICVWCEGVDSNNISAVQELNK